MVLNTEACPEAARCPHGLSLPSHSPQRPAQCNLLGWWLTGTCRLREMGCACFLPCLVEDISGRAAWRLHLVLVAQCVMRDGLISEGYLFCFSPAAVWGRSGGVSLWSSRQGCSSDPLHLYGGGGGGLQSTRPRQQLTAGSTHAVGAVCI